MATKYDPKVHPRQIQLLCEKGATTREVAQFFDMEPSELTRWKYEHPEVAEALVTGGEVADNRVERALYERAVGYSYDSEKIVTVSLGGNNGSEVQRVPIVEHVVPDPKAAARWLEARRPEVWRKRLAHTGPDGEALDLGKSEFDVGNLNPDERKQFLHLLISTKPR